MIPLLFSIILSGDVPHDDHAACALEMMTAVEVLADHGIDASGWCALDGHTMGPDELAATEPTMRPKRSPVYGE